MMCIVCVGFFYSITYSLCFWFYFLVILRCDNDTYSLPPNSMNVAAFTESLYSCDWCDIFPGQAQHKLWPVQMGFVRNYTTSIFYNNYYKLVGMKGENVLWHSIGSQQASPEMKRNATTKPFLCINYDSVQVFIVKNRPNR